MSDNVEFVKLKIDEVIPKLYLLSKNQTPVKIWQKGSSPITLRSKDFEKNANSNVLTLFSDKDVSELNGREVYFSYRLNNIDYFGRADLTFKDDVYLNIVKDLYRSEKRGNERLITFPHHQIYSYFEFENLDQFKEVQDKVVNIDEFKSSEGQIKVMKKDKLTDPVKNFIKHQLDDNQKLMGFRVLDLSINGISFIVKGEEKLLFKDDNCPSQLTLLFTKEPFKLKGAKVVYVVDFLGGSSQAFKVGLTFDENNNLSSLVNREIELSNIKNSTQQQFEEFIE